MICGVISTWCMMRTCLVIAHMCTTLCYYTAWRHGGYPVCTMSTSDPTRFRSTFGQPLPQTHGSDACSSSWRVLFLRLLLSRCGKDKHITATCPKPCFRVAERVPRRRVANAGDPKRIPILLFYDYYCLSTNELYNVLITVCFND